MRLLLLDHEGTTDVTTVALRLAEGLTALGQQVQSIRVTPELWSGTMPRLEPTGVGERTFAALSDEELADYREVLRRRLDDEINTFDPHCIHALQTWLLGELALESGVPYVLTFLGPELAAGQADPRCGRLAEQSAENAGAIFTPNRDSAAALLKGFPHVEPSGVQVVPGLNDPTAGDCQVLIRTYEQVWHGRAGGPPTD